MANDDWPPPAGSKPDTRSYDEILKDPWLKPEDELATRADAALGGTAVVLFQRGKPDLAALLVEAETFSAQRDERNGDMDLWLEVGSDQISRYSEEKMEEIRRVFDEVCERRKFAFDWIGVREILPEVGPDWRKQLKDQLGGKRPTNHARRARTAPPQFTENYLSFTNQGELIVYRALKKIQEHDLPREETIGIYPLAGGRIPGRTWEPDVLVTYKGRAGVLEIDGPHHNARRALDTTRDHLLMDAGIGFVDRIPVEVLSDDAELNGTLRRFLRRLRDVK